MSVKQAEDDRESVQRLLLSRLTRRAVGQRWNVAHKRRIAGGRVEEDWR